MRKSLTKVIFYLDIKMCVYILSATGFLIPICFKFKDSVASINYFNIYLSVDPDLCFWLEGTKFLRTTIF